jgi:hypothetical protein
MYGTADYQASHTDGRPVRETSNVSLTWATRLAIAESPFD